MVCRAASLSGTSRSRPPLPRITSMRWSRRAALSGSATSSETRRPVAYEHLEQAHHPRRRGAAPISIRICVALRACACSNSSTCLTLSTLGRLRPRFGPPAPPPDRRRDGPRYRETDRAAASPTAAARPTRAQLALRELGQIAAQRVAVRLRDAVFLRGQLTPRSPPGRGDRRRAC